MSKQVLSRLALLAIFVALLATIVLANLSLRGARVDLTENDLFTLSDGSKNILQTIDEPINLTFFYSRAAAQGIPQIANYGKRVEELLLEIAESAKGNVNLHIIEPESFSADEDRAEELGVTGVPVNNVGDKLYFGLAGTNALDESEAIPFFQPQREALLEYDINKLISTLARIDKPVVGVMSGLNITGGFNAQTRSETPPWAIFQRLQEYFDVRQVETMVSEINAPDVKEEDRIEVLLVIHPANLPDVTQYAIDQFVLAGGKVLMFVDAYAEASMAGASDVMMSAPPNPSSNPATLLKAWGLKVLDAQVVGDGGNALRVNFRPDQGPVFHVGMIGLPSANIAQDDVVTQGLETLNIGFGTALVSLDTEGLEVASLFHSSDKSALIPTFRIQQGMDPNDLLSAFNPTGELYDFAVRVRGKGKTAFPDGPPEGLKPPVEQLKEATDVINVIVVGDTDMLTDRMWVQVQDFFGQTIATPIADNGDFAINAIDNLMGSSDLIGIQSRASFTRPFTVVAELERQADAKFRATEERLQQELQETEQRLAELQQNKSADSAQILSPEQKQELLQFKDKQIKVRKELREVRHSLNKDIENLGTKLKVTNILLIPAILILMALIFGLYKALRGGRS